MLDLFNTSPANTNYQEFYGGGTVRDWVKPRGASMVRFMLIGAGGAGAFGGSSVGGGGGGSGAVTSWIGPAMFIPDVLRVSVGGVGVQSTVFYQQNDGTGFQLLTANGGSAGSGTTGGAGGTATTASAFAASGIYTSIAGQAGTAGSSTGGGTNQTASTTTFLSGGAGGAGSSANTGGGVTPNYGYPALPPTIAGGFTTGANGYFITQPILVGCGGAGGTTSVGVGTNGGNGGIGCGGGGDGEDNTAPAYGRRGGDGAVFIWAW